MRPHAITLTPARDSALGSVGQKLALGLIVCLPVPALAGSGLAIPLPSVVYRVAVAFAERSHEIAVRIPGLGAIVDESSDAVRAGTIRLSQAEAAALAGVTPGVEAPSTVPRSRGRAGGLAAGPVDVPGPETSATIAVDGPRRLPGDRAVVPTPGPGGGLTEERPTPPGSTTGPSPNEGGGEPPPPVTSELPAVPTVPELIDPGSVSTPELPSESPLPEPDLTGAIEGLPPVPSLP
jgi:hypothetical protein